jgi:hypothetical protein
VYTLLGGTVWWNSEGLVDNGIWSTLFNFVGNDGEPIVE